MSRSEANFLIYNTPNNEVRVDVFIENETLWLTQKAMTELFGANIFSEGELSENSVISILETTAAAGKNYNTIN
jgi:hypothetical protein